MNLKDYKNIYMCGIGGISMSGLAEILKYWGFHVSGSDGMQSKMTDHLISKGINVIIGQKEENVTDEYDLFIYTAAIKKDNPEYMKAESLGIKMIERGEFLGELTKLFKITIGISGTHGKTTTTSMLSCIFLKANLDPSIQVGSLLKQINGNYRVGESDYFIIEACEYCDSFLNFKQHSALITNIDNDHLDYFGNLDNIVESFKKYMDCIDPNGYVAINKDNENAMRVAPFVKSNLVTYSIKTTADVYGTNITYDELGCGEFDLYYKDELLGRVKMSVPGEHNVSNAVGAACLALMYNIDFESIKEGLKDYEGANRRLEYKGEFKGLPVYDDYAHHPTEIEATASAFLKREHNKSWAIFEPHTFSRVYNHKEDFAKVLSVFDNIIIIDIYAAREVNKFGITSDDLVEEVKKYNKNVVHISDYEDIYDYLYENTNDNDIIITLGAGLVTKVGELLVSKEN